MGAGPAGRAAGLMPVFGSAGARARRCASGSSDTFNCVGWWVQKDSNLGPAD